MLYRIEPAALQSLLATLRHERYTVLGPTLREGSLVYDEIDSVDDFPKGWSDEQKPGSYRLKKNGDMRLFGFTVGSHSWKQFLFPPAVRLLSASKERKQLSFWTNGKDRHDDAMKKYAFVGVRSCELHAMEIQDRVFLSGEYQDPLYRDLRKQLFIVAVNCPMPAETCFCKSMNTGPKVSRGFDLALTEIVDGSRHYFGIEVGSESGGNLLKKLDHRSALEEEIAACERAMRAAGERIKRTIDTAGIKELLYANADHPEWEKVASRCLTCANCTMVCPTCFCHTIEDTTDLTGGAAARDRKWDSCFTMGFSYIHGGSVRTSVRSRYRQWMMHKLASWNDQFGISGCVGCGRCITWCPVGIDITEEAEVFRKSKGKE